MYRDDVFTEPALWMIGRKVYVGVYTLDANGETDELENGRAGIFVGYTDGPVRTYALFQANPPEDDGIVWWTTGNYKALYTVMVEDYA